MTKTEEMEAWDKAQWLIFDHISSVYRTDQSKARKLSRALSTLVVRRPTVPEGLVEALREASYQLHEGLTTDLPQTDAGWLLRERFQKAEANVKDALATLSRSHDSRLADELLSCNSASYGFGNQTEAIVPIGLRDRIVAALRSTPAPDALREIAWAEAAKVAANLADHMLGHASGIEAATLATLRTEGKP